MSGASSGRRPRSWGTPAPVIAEPYTSGWIAPAWNWVADRGAHGSLVQQPVLFHPGVEQGRVVLAEHVDRGIAGGRLRQVARNTGRLPRTDLANIGQRQRAGVEVVPHLRQQVVRAGALAVDLVHEQQAGQLPAPDNPEQAARLRLDPLHGGDDEDHGIEHAQGAFHLGDEIRVAGGVDQVDLEVVQAERRPRPTGS